MESYEIEQKISLIFAESEKLMTKNLKSGHDFEHVRRVLSLGLKIGKSEGANMAILKPAIIMHDLGRLTEDGTAHHSKFSIPIAKKILKKVNYPKELWNPILYAIENHSWRCKPESLDAKCLWDSDKIDAMGAIGLMRLLMLGGQSGAIEYNPIDPFFNKKENWKAKDIFWIIYILALLRLEISCKQKLEKNWQKSVKNSFWSFWIGWRKN